MLAALVERDEWQITANKVAAAHLAISAENATRKQMIVIYLMGRVDVEKATLRQRQSSKRKRLFLFSINACLALSGIYWELFKAQF